jgi:ATP-dependent DNA helicase DinG
MLKNYFPKGYSPRETQELLLSKLETLLTAADSKKFIVVRAPTGSGKSALCTTISNYFSSLDKSSYLLCSRKFLQEQYMGDFYETYSNFWGKANYTCPLISASCSGCLADTATTPKGYMLFLRNNCTIQKIGDKCPYIQARKLASQADCSLLNIEAFLANSLQKLWSPREVLMIDEAHCLIDRAVAFFTVPLNDSWGNIPKVFREPSLSPKRFKTPCSTGKDYIAKLLIEYKGKEEELIKEGLSIPKGLKYAIKYLSIQNMEWVLDTEKRELIPLKIMPVLEDTLFKYGDKVILFSATLSPNACKELGLTSKNSVFIEVESTFPIDNHKINFIPTIGKLSKTTLQSKADSIGRAVLKARLEHEGKRGIVHTVSYKNVEMLKNELELIATGFEALYTLDDLGFIFHTKDKKLGDLLSQYSKNAGSVLVTPSLSEGFDGVEDLLEWQILVKCPFPYLGNPRIRALMESDFGKILFRERAIAAILQTLGRGIRTETDTCTTYILDKNISDLLGKCSRKSSKHYTSTSVAVKKLWKSRTTWG